jgi:hypothetical protein
VEVVVAVAAVQVQLLTAQFHLDMALDQLLKQATLVKLYQVANNTQKAVSKLPPRPE